MLLELAELLLLLLGFQLYFSLHLLRICSQLITLLHGLVQFISQSFVLLGTFFLNLSVRRYQSLVLCNSPNDV
jgi:hypothetical protein